jgi:hypothetical protein
MAWPDEAKRQIVLASLNSTMQENLLNRGIPSTYSELIARLHAISSDRDLFAIRKTSKTGGQLVRTQSRKPTSPVYDAEPMDWTPTPTVAVNNVRPRIEDKDLVGKRARWVTQSEFEMRRNSRLCIRCAREGCHSSRCPLKPAINPSRPHTQIHKAKARTPIHSQENYHTRVDEVATTDESASEESEKE